MIPPFFTITPPASLAIYFLLSLLLSFTGVALFGPWLAVLTQMVAFRKGKTFFAKAALQTSQAVALALCCIPFLLAAICLLWAGLAPAGESLLDLATGMFFYFTPQEVLYVPLGFLLFFVYLGLWKKLAPYPGLHFALGLTVALWPVGIALTLSLNPQEGAAFFEIYPRLIAITLPPALTSTVGLTQVWIFWQRNRADYGRDYYTFAIRYTSWWGCLASLFDVLLPLFFFWNSVENKELVDIFPIAQATILLWIPSLIACLLWLIAAKSPTPLRHKPGLFCAFALSLVTILCGILMRSLAVVAAREGLIL